MWIVRLALRNPYSVAVLAAVLLIMGALSLSTMLVDVFPIIDIPVVSVIWSYPGLTAEEMESRVVVISERAFSTTVQGVSRLESQSLPGVGNIRLYFEPGTEIGAAVAQVSAIGSTILRILPPGMTPPVILPFNASNVPIAQLTLAGEGVSEQSLFDYALNFLRVRLFTIPGLALPAPYGGFTREINVDVDPVAALGRGVSPQDVANTLHDANVIEPGGVARIGKIEYDVVTNSSPKELDDFRHFPVKVVGGRIVELGEVARIEDSHADQTNAVRINGKRSLYLNLLKKSNASTLSVIDRVRKLLPSTLTDAPKGATVKVDFDQSRFVRSAVWSVVVEALIAAVLVSTMILVFLKSWRSVAIVCTSIPLSILASIIGLKLTGNSINIMTLGGLALSIGMLVDDATVEIENINRNRAHAENITVAILKGASQIALPAIITTLAICIVFFPIVLLTGPAKFLFTPLSQSVVFAMLASYVLSRTLVPVLSRILLRDAPKEDEEGLEKPHEKGHTKETKSARHKPHGGVFGRMRDSYARGLESILEYPKATLALAGVILVSSLILPFVVIGRDFFPETDAGILKIHFRAPNGSRLEETERIVADVERHIRKIIPARELETINSMIGVPTYYNLAFVPTDNAAPMDVEIMVALSEKHAPSAGYRQKIRRDLAESFPGSVAYFQPADIVSQVLNFGMTAPLDIQIQSTPADAGLAHALAYAVAVRDRIRQIAGVQDAVIRQVLDYPTLKLDIDRNRAAQLGLTESDASSSLLFALTGSGMVQPNYYINPKNNVNYQVVTKLPMRQVASVNELAAIPITSIQPVATAGTLIDTPHPPAQPLGNLATPVPTTTMLQINHVNVQRTLDVIARVEDRDLGGAVEDIKEALKTTKRPTGVKVQLRGQNEVMDESFSKLGLGMILATVLVYLLMVTLFQSWVDPLVVMVAVPGSLCGVLWMLAATGTTINVESLMGAIMAIGIAVSNSNLLVSFANDYRVEHESRKTAGDGGDSALHAALEAGKTRLRPILMTAIAMVLGMIPMALGLSDSGSQNAPLGRAVIGGLLFSTLATLFVVPAAYAVLRGAPPTKHEVRKTYLQEEQPFEKELEHEKQRDLKASA